MIAQDRKMQRRHVRIPMCPASTRISPMVKQPFDGCDVVPFRHKVERATARKRLWLFAQQALGHLPVTERQCRDEVHFSAARWTVTAFGADQLGHSHSSDLFH